MHTSRPKQLELRDTKMLGITVPWNSLLTQVDRPTQLGMSA